VDSAARVARAQRWIESRGGAAADQVQRIEGEGSGGGSGRREWEAEAAGEDETRFMDGGVPNGTRSRESDSNSMSTTAERSEASVK
jgi:hypothetical protein